MRVHRAAVLLVFAASCGRVGYTPLSIVNDASAELAVSDSAATEAASDAPLDALSTTMDAASEVLLEGSTEASIDVPPDLAMDTRIDAPADALLDAASDALVVVPTDAFADVFADTPVDALADVVTDVRPVSMLNVSFSTFPTTCALVLQGSASCIEGALRLTNARNQEASSVWLPSPVVWTPSLSFQASLRFRVVLPSPTAGIGDGFMFVVHASPQGSAARGARGGALGYAGSDQDPLIVGITPSYGVEFDLYPNAWDSLRTHHLAINTGGRVDRPLDIASPGYSLADTAIYAWIDYDGPTTRLQAYVSRTSARPGAPTVSARLNAQAMIGSPVWFGLTAGTGDSFARIDLETFTLDVR